LAIGVLTIVAKLFVAGREIAIAWRFGVSPTVDAYQLAVTIVTWVPMMLVSAGSIVLVPRFVALHGRSTERHRFIAELNGTLLWLSLALAITIWIIAPVGAGLLGTKARAHTIDLTVRICRMMSPVVWAVVWAGYLSARLQARERFAYTITEAVPALGIAAAVVAPLLTTPEVRLGWATSAGYVAQVAVLALMVRRADGVGQVAFTHNAPEWSPLYRDLGVMVLGQVVITLALPIDQAFAARIGAGAVATLGYASRIVVLVTGLGAVVFTRALLPVFSREIVGGDPEAAARHARQWSFLLAGSGIALFALIWLLAPWAVSLFFQRGAFTASDADAVAHVLRFGMVQVPFYLGGLALVQWIAAKGSYSSLLWISCGGLVTKVLLSLLLVRPLGLAGLMLATAAMYGFSFACQYWVSLRQ